MASFNEFLQSLHLDSLKRGKQFEVFVMRRQLFFCLDHGWIFSRSVVMAQIWRNHVASRNFSRLVKEWNTKLHIYVGLFSLLFLWLFAVSGVIMNHPLWFGGPPARSEFEQPVELPSGIDDQATAEALLEQLGISGEIIFIVPKKDHLTFRVVRPNRRMVVDVDLQSRIAVVRTAIPKAATVLLALHTSTGVRTIWNEPQPQLEF